MKDKEFVAFIFRTMLSEHFHTKAAMARDLGIELRTLRLNFKKLESAKGASNAFERLVVYCCEHNIDILILYRRFTQAMTIKPKKGITRSRKEALQACLGSVVASLASFEYFCVKQHGVILSIMLCNHGNTKRGL